MAQSGDGALRITGGTLRGRRLTTPKGEDLLRPMRSQVRQALFNALGAEGAVEGARVLDLFAGSGCLGLEALSRGAAHAVFVDRAAPCLAVLRRNIGDLGVGDRAEAVQHDLGRGVADLVRLGPFDLVLVHPPFALLRGGPAPKGAPDVAALLQQVAESPGLLGPGARIAFETPRERFRDPAELPGLEVLRRREYGSTALFVARPREAAPDP